MLKTLRGLRVYRLLQPAGYGACPGVGRRSTGWSYYLWCSLVWLLLPLAFAQQEVRLKAADGVTVFGTFYLVGKGRPIILLFHQASSNRGEYETIAPELVKLGFNALAIDQRSGGTMWNRSNQTRDARGQDSEFPGALPDLEAALAWAKASGYRPILVWGSSYSAALVFVLAAKHPEIAGLLSFSPGEYLGGGHIVRDAATRVRVPVFATSAKFEAIQVKPIFEAIASRDKTQFVPENLGLHGSSALISTNKNEYWVAIRAFLNKFK